METMEFKEVGTRRRLIEPELDMDQKVLHMTLIAETYELTKRPSWTGQNPYEIVNKKLLSEEKSPVQKQLKEITASALARLRQKGIGLFILKEGDKLYCTSLPEKVNFFNAKILGQHRCSCPASECKRLSAAPDEMGGCAKVRDIDAYIEKYEWIKLGYEIYNTRGDCFTVVECEHFQAEKQREKVGISLEAKSTMAFEAFKSDKKPEPSYVNFFYEFFVPPKKIKGKPLW